MKTEFWMTGKTSHDYLIPGIKVFEKRIKQYLPFEIVEYKIPKAKTADQILKNEESLILKNLDASDYLILLDEKGQLFDSQGFATYFEKLTSSSRSKIVFLIGGAYGFTDQIYKRANEIISLSKLTFTHEMVRLIFLEQFYRILTIINKHPYHN